MLCPFSNFLTNEMIPNIKPTIAVTIESIHIKGTNAKIIEIIPKINEAIPIFIFPLFFFI